MAGWQPQGYDPRQQPQYVPQQPRKSRRGLFGCLGCGGLGAIVALIAAVGAAHPSSPAPAAGPLQTLATVAAAPSTAAAAVAQTLTYAVTGSAADVTYGPAGTNVAGTVPLRVTGPLGSPVYYAITAQLQGGGTVTCQILVNGKVTSQSSASGGYNIAQCEISKDPLSGQWTNTLG